MDARKRTCLALQQQFESLWTAQRAPEALKAAEAEQAAAQEAFGPHHPAMVRALFDLAMAAQATGATERFDTAKAQAQTLLGELETEAQQKPMDPATATLLLFLAERDWNINGDREEIRSQFQRALTIRETCLGMEDAETAEPLFRLAETHYLAGRWGEAIPFYERALGIYDKHEERDHFFYGKTVEGLAQSLAALSQYEAAVSYFERTLRWSEQYGQDRRSLYYVLMGYAEALKRLNRSEQAAGLEQQALSLLPKNNPGEFGFRL